MRILRTDIAKYTMKIEHILTRTEDLAEWKASKELCRDKNRSDASLGASALASCRSQGLRPRNSRVVTDINGDGKQEKIGNKTIRGKKYGGSTPDWS